MKRFLTLLILLGFAFLGFAQKKNMYEWKNGCVTIRSITDVDSITFSLPDDAVSFTTGNPSVLTENSMTATFSVTTNLVFSNPNPYTEQGVCYSSDNKIPSICDSKRIYGALSNGMWKGTLSSLRSGLLYYYRPYLQIADTVFYGQVKSFKTLGEYIEIPIVEVVSVDKKNTHKEVFFNVKCKSQNAVSVKFIATYVKNWDIDLSSGRSYADLVGAYGEMLTEDELVLVNSTEGLEICCPSAEESDTRLVVIAYNGRNEASEAVWADSRSLSIPAKPKVESTLYTDLDGEWVLEYFDTNNYYEKNTWRQFNSVITQNPDFAPASYEEWKNLDSYNVVLNALGGDEAQVKALYEDYKNTAAHYANKYEGQNQMVGVNFPCGNYVYAANQNVYTPWDLFTSEYYSAYDCAQLFYDFGPKVMFEVVGENEMVMKSDINNLAPLANFDGAYYMVGISDEGYLSECEFPVTISEDKNTITIHPAEVDGVKYYPGTIRYYSADYSAIQNRTNNVVKLTRGSIKEGWNPATTKYSSVEDAFKTNKTMNITPNIVHDNDFSTTSER